MLIKIDKNICRICLKTLDENDGINIFSDSTIVQKFKEITKLKIDLNDGLTETFCHDCLNKLHIASKFIELSKKSDLYMRKYVENLNNHFQFVSKKPIHCQFDEELNLLISEGFEVETSSRINGTNIRQTATKSFQQKFEDSNKTMQVSPVSTVTESFQTETSQCQEEDSHSLSSLDTFLQLPSAKKRKFERNCNQNKSFVDESTLIDLSPDKLINVDSNFECGICGRHYTKELYLKKHMKLHDKDKDLFCKICKQYFSNEEMIKMHFAECDHNYPFQCEICFLKFSQRRLLSLHAQNHLNEKLFQCNECDMKFNIMDQLKAHSKLFHKTKPHVRKYQAKISPISPTENIYECLQCEVKYPRDDLLQKHIQSFHETVACHICGDEVLAKSLNQHLEDHEKVNVIFQCGQCENQFNEEEELEKHFKLHVNSYECDFCEKTFEKPLYLNKHLSMCHQIQVSEAEIIELWLCEICNLPLVSKAALLDHQKSRHGRKFTDSDL